MQTLTGLGLQNARLFNRKDFLVTVCVVSVQPFCLRLLCGIVLQ